MAGGDLQNQRRDGAILRARIVELRNKDMSFRAIAADVDRDVAAVWRHYQTAMREIPAANVKEHQENAAKRLDEQLRRIDMEREVVMDVLARRHLTISNGHTVAEVTDLDDTGKPVYGDPLLDDGPVLAAVDRLGKLDDQEAKLLGLYPKMQISVRNEPNEADLVLAALFSESDKQIAKWEQEIHGAPGDA